MTDEGSPPRRDRTTTPRDRRTRPATASSAGQPRRVGVRARPDGTDLPVPAHARLGALHRAGWGSSPVPVEPGGRHVRHRRRARRHRAHRRDRARARGAGLDRCRAVHHRVRAAPASAPAHLARRPARRGPEPHLRPLGPGTLLPRAINVARWLTTHLGFIPLFTTKTAIVHVLDVHRRHRRRAHDRADLHGGDARGVLAGARRREGRRARAGRRPSGA